MGESDNSFNPFEVLDKLRQHWASPEFAAESERAEKDRAERLERARQRAERERDCSWRAAVATTGVAGAVDVFGELQRTEAVRAVEAWLASSMARGLCLRGPVGCGKTMAALWAVRHWTEPRLSSRRDMIEGEVPCVRLGHRVSWLGPDALVSAVLHAYDDSAPDLHQHVVLDDLGRETRQDFPAALCQLLETAGHVLLITTNLTRAQMRERYEPRVIDRLNHRVIAVDVRGPSLRRRGDF